MLQTPKDGDGMLQGVIFDMDGTILDSMPMWDHLASAYLRSLGCTPLPDADEATRTMSMQQIARYFQTTYAVPLSAQEIMDGVNAMAQAHYERSIPAKPGAAAFLELLHRQGVSMCVATATDQPLIEAALERLGLRRYFKEVLTCTGVGAGKDQPLIYREALRCLGTPKDKTLVFEDALYALRTAAANGFRTVAVRDNSEPDQAAMQSIADFYLPDYTDLATFRLFAEAL